VIFHLDVVNVSVLSDISLSSYGLGQYRQVPPNLRQCSDTIWRLLFQKKNVGCGAQLTYLAASNILDEELFFTILQEPLKASKCHRLALSSFRG
jgi:hypothetical protein